MTLQLPAQDLFMLMSDFSGAFMPGLYAFSFPRSILFFYFKDAPETSRFPRMKLLHMLQVYDSGESNMHSCDLHVYVAFPFAISL